MSFGNKFHVRIAPSSLKKRQIPYRKEVPSYTLHHVYIKLPLHINKLKLLFICHCIDIKTAFK